MLVEVDHPGYDQARDLLARFAELERSPEHVHTYRLSALAVWNAAVQGLSSDDVVAGLASISRFELPEHVVVEIRDLMARHGVCRIVDGDDPAILRLDVSEPAVHARVVREPKIAALVETVDGKLVVRRANRGPLKRALLGIGYPVDDIAGLVEGTPLAIATRGFEPYRPRPCVRFASPATG